MADISIKDAPLINNISGTEKIPVSDGSGKPAAITVNQILNKVDLSNYTTTEIVQQAVQNVNQKADKANTIATTALNLAEGIQGSLSSFALKSELPTKVSQLENDSNYATTNQIPTNISQFNNDCGFVQSSRVDTIETSVSSLRSQMITGDVKYIKKVTALPDNPDPNTLYIITS